MMVRVLIADADRKFLAVVHSYLCDVGYEVSIAKHGIECIAKLRELLPDVLIVDQGLLWGGGDGVIAEMRFDPLLHRIPIILTADSRQQFGNSANRRHLTCLQKPFRLGDLLRQIKSAAWGGQSAAYGERRYDH
jgi:CheY-like chemotaxis protein